jgi:PEP-CTERM motif
VRTFNRFSTRDLRFRFVLILTGAVILVGALAPIAKADLIVYFNFEDSVAQGPPDFTSDVIGAPDFNPGGGVVLTMITTDYTNGEMLSNNPGTALNRSAGDIDVPPVTPDLDVALTDAGNNNNRHFDFNVFSSGGFYQDMTLSFAVKSRTGGFDSVTVQYSINGGGTWTTFGTAAIPTDNTPQLRSFGVPAAANNAPNLAFRFFFTGGTGTDPRTIYSQFDNLQLTGTIVPEPATVAGGMLGVLGLCWHHRRRLIRSVRFRRT